MVPKAPNGTLTQKTSRQSMSASTPPRIRPMNEPAMAAIMLIPIAIPRSSTGKASVRMAVELAMSRAPPMPWATRSTMSSRAPVAPLPGVSERPMDATVKARKPKLYILTRPKMSPMRPKVTTSTAVTTRYPISIHSR